MSPLWTLPGIIHHKLTKKKGDAAFPASPFLELIMAIQQNLKQNYEPVAAVLGARIQEPFHMTKSLLKWII
jgi:hypothetical protein